VSKPESEEARRASLRLRVLTLLEAEVDWLAGNVNLREFARGTHLKNLALSYSALKEEGDQ